MPGWSRHYDFDIHQQQHLDCRRPCAGGSLLFDGAPMKFRIKKVELGRMSGRKFIPIRSNPQPALKMLNDVFALATPAGITKSGTLRKNPGYRRTLGCENFLGFSSSKKRTRATSSDKEQFREIADEWIRKSGVVVQYWRKADKMAGESFIADDGAKVVNAPRPTSANKLFILLHEIGHHYKGHFVDDRDTKTPLWQERQANAFAIDILKHNGIDTSVIESEERERLADIANDLRSGKRTRLTQSYSNPEDRFRLSPNPVDQFRLRPNPGNSIAVGQVVELDNIEASRAGIGSETIQVLVLG
jgi:hypothetical protein